MLDNMQIRNELVSIKVKEKLKICEGFEWRPHQLTEGAKAWNLLSTTGWVYLMHEPRTGKTGTALYCLEHHPDILNVLIVTTKNGILGDNPKEISGGWVGFIADAQSKGWCLRHNYKIVNHHSVSKVMTNDWKPSVILLDEVHKCYSTPQPKTPILWKSAKMVTGNCPVIYLSATPHAQTMAQVYWQLALCNHTPFLKMGYTDFNKWFDRYGKFKTIPIGNGKAVPVYTDTHEDDIDEVIRENFLTLTYQEVGGCETLEPVDKTHYVELTGVVKRIYDEYEKNEVMKLNDTLVHTMTARDLPVRLHQIEGGTLKYIDMWSITDADTGIRLRGVKPKEYYWIFPVLDKIEYIKATWGDNEKMVIMHEYKQEAKLLNKHFEHARILQATTYAEAIDLFQYDDMIIYSMNFSTSSYIQRRDRQKHLTKRKKPITIHYICVKGGVSEQVLNTVKDNKENYSDKFYKKRMEFQLNKSNIEGVSYERPD